MVHAHVFKTIATCFGFLYKPLSGCIVTKRLDIQHVHNKSPVQDNYTCCILNHSVTVVRWWLNYMKSRNM
jgi:hypothetical protein